MSFSNEKHFLFEHKQHRFLTLKEELSPKVCQILLNVGIYNLGLLASSGWGFSLVQRYNSTLPDWQKTPGDRHFIGDFNGDGKANLYLFNSSNWSIAYLELLQSNGSGLSMATR